MSDESPKEPAILDYQRQGRTPTAARVVPMVERVTRVHLFIALAMIVSGTVLMDGGDLLRKFLLFFGITSPLCSCAVIVRAVRPVRRIGWISLWSALFGIACISLWVMANRPHERDGVNRIKCAINMRAIGQVVIAYARANGDRFPNSLDQIVDGWSDMGMFVCPSTEDTPAPSTVPAKQAIELTLGGHLSYIYCGKGLHLSANADAVVLWEWPGNHFGRGSNALFGDGHVEWLEPSQVVDLEAGINPPRSASAKPASQRGR